MLDRNGITPELKLTVKGPVNNGGRTSSVRIYEDNAKRTFLIYVDETEAQDEQVRKCLRLLLMYLVLCQSSQTRGSTGFLAARGGGQIL